MGKRSGKVRRSLVGAPKAPQMGGIDLGNSGVRLVNVLVTGFSTGVEIGDNFEMSDRPFDGVKSYSNLVGVSVPHDIKVALGGLEVFRNETGIKIRDTKDLHSSVGISEERLRQLLNDALMKLAPSKGHNKASLLNIFKTTDLFMSLGSHVDTAYELFEKFILPNI